MAIPASSDVRSSSKAIAGVASLSGSLTGSRVEPYPESEVLAILGNRWSSGLAAVKHPGPGREGEEVFHAQGISTSTRSGPLTMLPVRTCAEHDVLISQRGEKTTSSKTVWAPARLPIVAVPSSGGMVGFLRTSRPAETNAPEPLSREWPDQPFSRTVAPPGWRRSITEVTSASSGGSRHTRSRRACPRPLKLHQLPRGKTHLPRGGFHCLEQGNFAR